MTTDNGGYPESLSYGYRQRATGTVHLRHARGLRRTLCNRDATNDRAWEQLTELRLISCSHCIRQIRTGFIGALTKEERRERRSAAWQRRPKGNGDEG